jgi:UDPglucose 6-dehydrogenase
VLNERDWVTASRRLEPSGRGGGPKVERISVIGLGKLGLCLAAVLADSGFNVIGVDVDGQKVNAINRGKSPIYETGLAGLITSTRASFKATLDYDMAVAETRTTFVVVPTPSNASGGFSLTHVKAAMRRLGKALSQKTSYHLVVLTSTVMPGSMDETVLPILEQSSGKKCGSDFGLCYNPEFIALGNVIEGLHNPDLVLIGESDRAAGDALVRIHTRICANSAPVERMTFLNAEVAKIAVNAFVTMKMSFANTLAEICERLPNGDVDRITQAVGRDKRIGPAYLRGAIGYGGPCFPRDNMAFANFAEKVGVGADLARATDRVNRRQVGRIVELIKRSHSPNSSRIGILGITYKPNTNVTEGSQALMVAEALARRGFEVHVYDPAVGRVQLRELSNLKVEATAEECVAKSDVCVIGTPWQSFSKLDKSMFSNKIVLDCWRMLDGNKPDDPSHYIALGQDMTSKKVLRV